MTIMLLQSKTVALPLRLITTIITLTLCVIVVLGGLHGFTNLHADDVDLGLAVLQHLQRRLEHLLVLRGGETVRHVTGEARGGQGEVITCLLHVNVTVLA